MLPLLAVAPLALLAQRSVIQRRSRAESSPSHASPSHTYRYTVARSRSVKLKLRLVCLYNLCGSPQALESLNQQGKQQVAIL
jgi:hypothetical protein